jgi:transcriptional regulator with XRE-family HTH domain
MGWSIQEAARALGVDPASWGKWERGQTILYRQHRAPVARLLDLTADALDQEMASRWNRSHEHAL